MRMRLTSPRSIRSTMLANSVMSSESDMTTDDDDDSDGEGYARRAARVHRNIKILYIEKEGKNTSTNSSCTQRNSIKELHRGGEITSREKSRSSDHIPITILSLPLRTGLWVSAQSTVHAPAARSQFYFSLPHLGGKPRLLLSDTVPSPCFSLHHPSAAMSRLTESFVSCLTFINPHRMTAVFLKHINHYKIIIVIWRLKRGSGGS